VTGESTAQPAWKRLLLRVGGWFLHWIDRRVELQEEEQAILRGHAALEIRGITHNGLFVLTSERLALRDFGTDVSLVSSERKGIDVPLTSILEVSVKTKKRSLLNPFPAPYLEVSVRGGELFRFQVVKPEAWESRIKDLLTQRDEPGP
jgi:hypothetical protein